MLSLAQAPLRRDPNGLALIHCDERWNWGELDRRSAAWAARLGARGVQPDDLVAFTFPNGPDFLALTFGIYRCGATPAPLSSKLPPVEREAILAVMRPATFFSETEYG